MKSLACSMTVIFLGFFSQFCHAPQAIAANEDGSEPIVVELEQTSRRVFTGTATLASMPKSNARNLTLFLKNNSESEVIKLGEVNASCGCVRIGVFGREIEPLKQVPLKVEVKIPTNQNTVAWRQTISFSSKGGNTTVRINLVCNILGLLAIQDPSFSIFVDKTEINQANNAAKRQKISLPVVISEPVKIDNIGIRGTENINLFDIKMRPASEFQAFLDVSFLPSDIPEEGLHVNIELFDRKSESKASVRGVVVLREPLELMPTTAVFRWQEDGSYKANVMLLNRSGEDADIGGYEKEPVVLASISGKACKAIVESHNIRLARIAISLSQENFQELSELESGELLLSWEASWGPKKVVGKNSVAIL